MSDFRDYLAEDVQDVFLNTDEFGDLITYIVVGGASLDLVVNIEPVTNLLEDEYRMGTEDEITVHICKDPDADSGGVRRAQIGDTLLRSVADDPLQQPYYYTGNVDNETRYSQYLTFRRTRVNQVGVESRP